MKTPSTFLIIVALIAGMVGCVPGPVQYDLTISITEGGEITTPGEATSSYDEGTIVPLVVFPHTGYRFVNWTGDVDTIDDVNAASTTITMEADYEIIANFNEQAAHRIEVRVMSGVGEFYDRMTGRKFIPRGNNYIRLADQAAWGEPGNFYHSNFNHGLYNSTKDGQALAKMEQDGYNVIRVWINHLAVVDPSGHLSIEYLENVTDFLERSREKSIYVMFTLDYPPGPGYAEDIPYYQDIEGQNVRFLTRESIDAEQRFWRDFILGLIDQGAPLDAIFAYELRNEAFFDGDLKPLSLASGFVKTGNGQTYDMSKPEDKQRMMDENLVYWIDQVRAAIQEVDPTALVTVGFFWPQEPNPARIGDPRVIRTHPAIWGSSADFIDLHLYPGLELTMSQYVENYEMDGFTLKPIIMGEYGAFKHAFWFVDGASRALHDWQVESCQYGFDGWLLWTWDTDEQPELWNALSDGELINQVLAPKNRPDPCVPGPYSRDNLAFGKPTVASDSLSTNPPEMAVDGSFATWWGSGNHPPQWIEVDLQAVCTIGKVRLATSQWPAGETVHQVLGKGPGTGGDFQLLHEFRGFTEDNLLLEYTPAIPWEDIQFIRIETSVGPSWVAWREIEILEP